ncbi:VOC family protein [Goodfellowiella coeruleoviolacea]|uniref:VOC domain-containing protein n=1 Tax=Goodfellowiella coeruleoviolacea TaxID=334858 RepID=A0AAE3G8L1_9PSEU|nr:VOC family protein [Goodfellowiella coeruleoviolacea]MCP2163667.1 hypothetical protein [Goodfellowiella coeruleoviolacea]
MSTHGPDFLSLQVRDLTAARTFYCELLGIPAAPGGPEGVLVLDSRPIPFALRGPEAGPVPEGAVGQGVVLWLACDDVDALCERLDRAGATIVRPVADGPFGRACTVADPDGYQLTLHGAAPGQR